jgi:hypothetical protein
MTRNYNYGYPISYGNILTEEEMKKRWKQVGMGVSTLLILYSISTQINQAAYAADPPPGPPGTPGLPAPVPVYLNPGYFLGIGIGLILVAGVKAIQKAIQKN